MASTPHYSVSFRMIVPLYEKLHALTIKKNVSITKYITDCLEKEIEREIKEDKE